MTKSLKIVLLIVLAVGGGLLAATLLPGGNLDILNPKGPLALKERNLMITATLLMLIVVIPVFMMTFAIAWKYRASNTQAKYTPEWDHSRAAETVWWGIPLLLISVLSVIIWQSSHDLDPARPLASTQRPVTIQVVALQWKWLFIYPEQGIATVNQLQFPVDTPINFVTTADAPMNSFWIPSLGGQIYAMAGMSTKLHLMATEAGSYNGSSANLSGQGFSGMKFVAKATSQTDFDDWVSAARQSPDALGQAEYDTLARPSQNNPPATYSSVLNGLYDGVVMKYMTPSSATQPMDAHGAHTP